MIPDLSKSERETLKAVYRHSKDGAEAHTGAVAETLGVTPGTVTATVKRLADRRLVDHKPYHGVKFTPEGRRTAVSLIRRHRIVERFLADMLGYSWNEADRLAPTFEHDLPDEVEERIFRALNRPTTCPHGFPIPAPEEDDIPAMPPLYDLEAGDEAEVALPSSTDPEVVRFLEELGVRPGVSVEVREKHPFDGPLVVRVDGEDRTLGERIARHIYVRKTNDQPNDQVNEQVNEQEAAHQEDDAVAAAAPEARPANAGGRKASRKNGGDRAAKETGGTAAAAKEGTNL